MKLGRHMHIDLGAAVFSDMIAAAHMVAMATAKNQDFLALL